MCLSSVWRFFLRTVPNYDRWGLYPQALIVVVCLFCFQWWPLIPTVAIGFLGVVAAIMTVRADHFTHAERVVYILIAFALFIIEMTAVYRDRDEHDRQQTDLRMREGQARKEERDSFAKLLTQGQTSIKQSDAAQRQQNKQFSTLLKKEDDIFAHEEQLVEGLNGKLIPGDDKLVYNQCGTIPKDAVLLLLGDGDSTVAGPFPYMVMMSKEFGPVITLDRDRDGLMTVTLDIKSADGKIITRLNKDGFAVNRNSYLQMKKNPSSLLVIDEYGQEVLNAQYLNRNVFRLTGLIRYPGRDPMPIAFPNVSDICLNTSGLPGAFPMMIK